MLNKKESGDLGEIFAVKLLLKNKYKILTRNFRSKFGEIDIVAMDKDTLVFIEVKTRWSKKYGKPEEAVTPKKLSNIKRTADFYCLLHKNAPKKKRIDVVAIEAEEGMVTSVKIIKVD